MAASKDKGRAILSYATPNPVGPYKLVTPLTPKTGAETTRTPVMPVMGGTLVNLPTPVAPTKQTTPVAPPMADKLVNVPKQQGRVVNKITQEEADKILRLNEDLRYAAKWGDAEKRAADLYAQIRDPKIRMRYDELVRRRMEYGDGVTVEQARREAAADLNSLYSRALQRGFKPEVIGDVDGRALRTLEEIFYNQTQRPGGGGFINYDKMVNSIKELNPIEQRTLATLAQEWSGSFDELVNTARSLSK